MIGSHSRIGSQPASARIPTTMPKPRPAKSAVIHAARAQPGASNRRRPVRRRGGGACASCSSLCSWTAVNSCHLESSGTLASVQRRLRDVTIARVRISAWPSPQSSVQIRR